MVLEYIRYAIPGDRAEAFVEAYDRAGRVLDADPHCLRWELAQGDEEPQNFVVRIEWDSLAGHLEGFRTSAAFAEFFAAVRPFYADIQEMKHYHQVIPEVDGQSGDPT